MAREPLTAGAVRSVIAEFKQLGREQFLAKYGFGRARDYFIPEDGQDFDSKAVVGVAYRFLPGGQPRKASEFNGGVGQPNDAAAMLRRLGFEVVPRSDPDWTLEEHILALELYLETRASPPPKRSEKIVQLSELLVALGQRAGVWGTAKFRNPEGVYMKLMNFRRFDPIYTEAGKVGLQRGNKLEAVVWDRYAGQPDLLAADAAAIRAAVQASEPTAMPAVDDYETQEGGVVMRVHRDRERDRSLIDRKKRQAMELQGHLRCEVCDFDFAAKYGDLGTGFVEAHHKKPVSQIVRGETTKLRDLALVCANCHRMLHRNRLGLSVDALRTVVSASSNGDTN